jgi:hypothetical protein
MKKKISFSIIAILVYSLINACPVCEKQQPKFLRGITHGAGPQSNWDWVIIAIVTLITVLTFYYSMQFLLFPKEANSNHIKNAILNY